MVFVKFFDVWRQRVRGPKKFHVKRMGTVSDLVAQIDAVEDWGALASGSMR